jgi:hypothetical protein
VETIFVSSIGNIQRPVASIWKPVSLSLHLSASDCNISAYLIAAAYVDAYAIQKNGAK